MKHEIFNKLTRIPVAIDHPQSLKTTTDQIEALLRALEITETRPGEINEDETYRRIVISKFPRTIIRNLAPPGQIPTLEQARKALRAIVQAEEDINVLMDPLNSDTGKTPAPGYIPITSPLLASTAKQGNNSTTDDKQPEIRDNQRRGNRRPPSCPFCNGSHFADECNVYETSDKRKKALPPDACIICLRTSHSPGLRNCPSNSRCYHCRNRSHHSAFFPAKFGFFERPMIKQEEQPIKQIEQTKTPTPPKRMGEKQLYH